MDAGWWVRLEGEESYLRDLAMSFSGREFRVVAEGVEFYASSAELAALSSARAVRDRAAELLAIACGSAEVELGNFKSPRVVSAVKVDELGAKHHFIAVSSELRLRSEIHGRVERSLPGGSVEVVDVLPNPPRPGEWLKLALSSEDVADALAILGRNDLRWHDLFHVYEIVQAEARDRLFTDGWASRMAIRRFTQTANSRRAVGRDARHGHDHFAAPRRPLDLAEARQLVVTIVRHWLESKVPPAPPREVVVEVRHAEQGVSISDSTA